MKTAFVVFRRQRRYCSRWRAGFTLLELLVVVAILAILAGLLLPGLAKAKSRALGIVCINNESQITKGWFMYSADSQGVLPPNAPAFYGMWASGYETFDTAPDDNVWQDTTNYGLLDNSFQTSGQMTLVLHMDETPPFPVHNSKFSVLAGYVHSTKIYKCPADPGSIVILGKSYPRVRSYAMNQYVGTYLGTSQGTVDGSKYWDYATMSSFLSPGPSQTFLLGDMSPNAEMWNAFEVDLESDYWAQGASSIPSAQHNMAGTFSFADGHVVLKHWKDARTFTPAYQGGADGSTTGIYSNLEQPHNPDLQWLETVASARRDSRPLALDATPSP